MSPRTARNPALADDDQLMASVKNGSIDALGVLYDRYCDRAYRVARSICRDHGRAQEAVQETFISIWRSRYGYQERGSVEPWVMSVTRHRAIDVARRNDPHSSHRASDRSLDTLAAPNTVAEHVQRRIQARSLQDQLAKLPDAQREVIVLAFYGELTHAQIAAHLDLPAGTVKGRMRLGLQRLRGDID